MTERRKQRSCAIPPFMFFDVARLDYDFATVHRDEFTAFWSGRTSPIKLPKFTQTYAKASLEVGSGTGDFLIQMARNHPDEFFIGVERDRMRGKKFAQRVAKANLKNLAGFRGNVLPPVMHEAPPESLDRIYILYPCPWPKMSQRKNRWYVHPFMPHLLKALKVGGQVIWASDQAFYIEEAKYVCETKFGLRTVAHGPVVPPAEFATGRTKFERTFLASGQPCYELISEKLKR